MLVKGVHVCAVDHAPNSPIRMHICDLVFNMTDCFTHTNIAFNRFEKLVSHLCRICEFGIASQTSERSFKTIKCMLPNFKHTHKWILRIDFAMVDIFSYRGNSGSCHVKISCLVKMVTSWHGSLFLIPHYCDRNPPLKNVSNVNFPCFLSFSPEQAVARIVVRSLIWDVMKHNDAIVMVFN